MLTTLIWVYLSWLILLIGAQLAFYVQCPQYLRHGQDPIELAGCGREQAALAVMYLIARGYTAGGSYWSGADLAAALDIPALALAPVLACLERCGLIIATEKEQFVPARDPAGIALIDIIGAVRSRQGARLVVDVDGAPTEPVMREVEAAIRGRLAGRTLKDWAAGLTPPRSSPH